MNIFEVRKKGKPVEYYADTWSSKWNEEKQQAEVFVKGIGPVKLKKNVTRTEIEVADPWTYAEIRRLWDEYGKHVAEAYVDKYVPCAGICNPVYLVIAKDCIDPEMLDILKEKTGFDVYKGSYTFAMFGMFAFPIVEFDDHLIKEHGYDIEKHGSQKDFVTDKWGEDFAKRMEKLWENCPK